MTPTFYARPATHVFLKKVILGLGIGLSLSTTVQVHAQAQEPIRIHADLSEAPRKLYHADITLPVKSGPVTVTAAKWIPGTHMPSGPVDSLTGIVFKANGKVLPWRRDDIDLYSFHVTVPEGVTELDVHVDAIVTSRVSDKLAVLEWERLLLYPAATPVREISIEPTVTVPAGWGIGTALTPTGAPTTDATGSTTHYAATTVEMLEDSPVISGRYFKEVALGNGEPKHFIDVAADDEADLKLTPQFFTALNNLVKEVPSYYGSHHYKSYHFLLTLSDIAGGEGLEHHQSSDNGTGAHGYSDPAESQLEAELLPHEFTHSWNGKYRRPAGLATPDYTTPMQGKLLWVYEGMTQYLGNLMAARTGFETPEQYRDALAYTAASLDNTTGRVWRPTEDTARAASVLRGGSSAWSGWRRSQDYYPEGELLWLDADVTIRQLTKGQKSLRDFLVLFLSKGGDTEAKVVPYDLNEIVADLKQVVPDYDWDAFFQKRVLDIAPRADFAGIEEGGYKLVYKEKPASYEGAINGIRGRVDEWFSAGISLRADGTISDVRIGSDADKAKLFSGEKVVAVNGRSWSGGRLHDAVKAAKGTSEPIHLIVQSDSYIYNVDLNYHEGPKYPVLERVSGKDDLLDEVLKPYAKLDAVKAESKSK